MPLHMSIFPSENTFFHYIIFLANVLEAPIHVSLFCQASMTTLSRGDNFLYVHFENHLSIVFTIFLHDPSKSGFLSLDIIDIWTRQFFVSGGLPYAL